MKHSKGPWEAREILWRPGDACYYREIVDATELRVGEVWVGVDGHPQREEGLANLRLVLHATQLLTFVQEHIERRCPSGGPCKECYWQQVDCALQPILALLDKITGKEAST